MNAWSLFEHTLPHIDYIGQLPRVEVDDND